VLVYNVKNCPSGREPIGWLAEELIVGLGEFRYEPARQRLREILFRDEPRYYGLDCRHFGPAALDALLKLDPARKREVLVEVMARRKIDEEATARALQRIDESGDPSFVEPLLSLLETARDRSGVLETITRLLAGVEVSDAARAKLIETVRARLLIMVHHPHPSSAMEALLDVDREAGAASLLPSRSTRRLRPRSAATP